jgi:hypothetical protein
VDNVAAQVMMASPERSGDKQFGNSFELLFYDAATRARAERGVSTGVRQLDSVLGLGALFQQSWAKRTSGSIARLLAASSIRVTLPIEGWDESPEVDLNPQHKTLQTFASDCSARLSGQ